MTPSASIDSLLKASARRFPARPALSFGELTIDYGELDADVERLAQRLRPCVERAEGDRVAVIAPNAPAAVIGMLAAWRCGAVAVPLGARLREYDLERILDDAEPAAVVAVESHGGFSFRELLERLARRLPSLRRVVIVEPDGAPVEEIEFPRGDTEVEPVPDGTAAILYTSGSTGAPKGAIVTHDAALHGATEMQAILELVPEDRCALVIPVAHAFGFACLFACMRAASLAVLVESSTSLQPLLRAVERQGATVLHGSPPLFASLLKARPDGLASVRTGFVAGSSCPSDLLERLDETPATILNCWGMTELGAASACRIDDPPKVRHLTVGRPLPGYQVRIEQGEVQVRGPYVTPGYHRRPEQTAEAFDGEWLRTGDLGSLDYAGYLTISGRAKEVVHVAGFSVFPAEVENFLLTHPDVRQAAVVGVADERSGEVLQAFVVPQPGAALTPGALLRYARPRIAGYKLPYAITLVDELPLLGSGKTDRVALARAAEEGAHVPG